MARLSRDLIILLALTSALKLAGCQLPDDIQRELNQNLAEQARIQAMRQQQQQRLAQSRASPGGATNSQAPARPVHDPNNYSYQQVSPPIQYSYYQPYGEAANPSAQQSQQGAVPKMDFDLNNLNFDMPQPQARVSGAEPAAATGKQAAPVLVPSFTGAGGLPVMQPPAAAAAQENSYAPAGQPPLAPQARVQQGPPLTEADFKDITGGENYGAPEGNDFGAGGNSRADNTDAQLREFGLPAEPRPVANSNRRQSSGGFGGITDFGGFNPLGEGGSNAGGSRRHSSNGLGDFGNFGNFGAPGGNQGFGAGNDADAQDPSRMGASGGGAPGGDFDFASQPSNLGGDQTTQTMNGGAPGSLQNLLGSTFPGLGGNSNLDGLARGQVDPQQQKARNDDGALDIADLGDKSDSFSGADLGGFEQPGPQNDQDFNYGSASEQQPKSVPYPDSNPQLVGTLWALGQPQSLTQTRYNALPDKGTYQDYPAYQSGDNEFGAVAEVVDNTPKARHPAAGRYATPSASELAPEYASANGRPYDYGQAPVGRAYISRYGF